MALGPFFMNEGRALAVDISEPLTTDSLGILIQRPVFSTDLTNFLRPFSYEVGENDLLYV